MTVTVLVPGTLGEWVQGWIGDGGEALVSCVVSRKGRTRIERGGGQFPLPEKAGAALVMAREKFGVPLSGWSLSLENPLPVAMGLASSTVDVCGVFASVAALGGRTLSEEELFALCCEIEPSDGVMFRGLALVDHLSGRLLELLPPPPPLCLTALLPERTLETEAYRRDPLFVKRVLGQETRHRKAYRVLRQGLLRSDLRLVAAGASESAAIQQEILPRDEWSLLTACMSECGGEGVVVAHSGTASAVIFASRRKAQLGNDWLRARWEGGRIEPFIPGGGGVRTLVDEISISFP